MMTTEPEDFNDENVEALEELQETAPVTRAATMANAFMEAFFDQFAEAELHDDKMFVISLSVFDAWLVKAELMPADVDDSDGLIAGGKSMLRNYVRRTINRASAFGKTVWPPFSIEPQVHGKTYEVRLLEYYADKLPIDLTATMKRYLVNKLAHWGHISAFMHSEQVQKRAPEVALRFYGVERMIDLTMRNTTNQLENLNGEILEAHRQARRMMLEHKDDAA